MSLKNIIGITIGSNFIDMEEFLSKRNAVEILNKLEKLPAGTFSTLSSIHRQIFAGIYDFAGKLRTENISKGNFLFAPARYLSETINNIEKMPQKNFNEIVEKYVEMNIAHPFREGNGRSLRIWLNHILATKVKNIVDWSQITASNYMKAMLLSPTNDNFLKNILSEAMTEKIYSEEIFLEGIDASWAYEGLNHYSALAIKLEQKNAH